MKCKKQILNLLKKLVVPYYRIRIWVKNRSKPYQGIRQIEQHNIDLVHNMIKTKAHTHINTSLIVDIEVAMLSKNSSTIIQFINSRQRKPKQ